MNGEGAPPQVIRRDDGSFHVLNVDLDSMSPIQRTAVAVQIWPQVKALMEASGEFKEPGRIGSRRTSGIGSYDDIHKRVAAATRVSHSMISNVNMRAAGRPDVLERMRQDEYASFNDVLRDLGFKIISKIEEGRSSTATHTSSFFGHGDKFEEATEPLVRYMAPWRKKDFKFTHVNPKEAKRRLSRLDELIDSLVRTREDLAERAHVASYAAPSERKKGER